MTHLNELYLILNKSLKWNKSHLGGVLNCMLVKSVNRKIENA